MIKITDSEKRYPLLEYFDDLQQPHHSMLLYEKTEFALLIKSKYVKNSLKKQEHTICITHENPKYLEQELFSTVLDVYHFKQKKLLHIYQIENIMKHKDGLRKGFQELLKMITAESKPPYNFMGRIISDLSTKEGISTELELEHLFHSNFERYSSSFLCTYNIEDMSQARRQDVLENLLANHHHMIYAVEPENAVAFETDLLALR
jgi:hypothetical protein